MRVPFRQLPDLDQLSPRVRREIERNFAEMEEHSHVSGAALAAGFDCHVDPVAGTDSVVATNTTFQTINFATNTMYDRGFIRVLRIGVVANFSGTETPVPVSETVAAQAAKRPRRLTIMALGRAVPSGYVGLAPSADYVVWNQNALAVYGGLTGTLLDGLDIATGAKTSFFAGVTKVSAYQCRFNAGGSPGAILSNVSWLDTCALAQVAVYGDHPHLRECYVQVTVSMTWTTDGITCWNTVFDPQVDAARTITFNASDQTIFAFIGCSSGYDGWQTADGSSTSLTFSFTGAKQSVYWIGGRLLGSAAIHNRQLLSLSITGSDPEAVVIIGMLKDLTISNAGATFPGSDYMAHLVDVSCNIADIRGPAIVNLGVLRWVTFRGMGVSGHVAGRGVTSSATFLTLTACTDSNIGVACVNSEYPPVTNGKSFALDATSSRNIIDFAGASTFLTAGTDAGVGNIIRQT